MEIIKVKNGMLSTNTYLIGELNEWCYVIDPSDEYKRIKNVIETKFGNKIKAILLTHGHLDHIGSVDKLVSDYKCEVYLSDKDKIYVDGSLEKYPNSLQEFNIKLNCETIDAYFIKDKNIIVYETPGHTPGSVCYYFVKENVLFSGDTLFKSGAGRCDLTGGSERDLINSLRILKKLDDSIVVLCGHEGDTTIGIEKRQNPYMMYI